MLKVLILSPPLTGVLELYTLVYDEVKIRRGIRDALLLYDIFNGRTVRQVVCEKTCRDPVTSTALAQDLRVLEKLDSALFWEIAFNADWVWSWLDENSSMPWLGRYWVEILEKLDRLDRPVILGDTLLWIEAESIAEKFRDALILFTRRRPEHIQRQIRASLRQTPLGLLLHIFRRSEKKYKLLKYVFEFVLCYERLSGEKVDMDVLSPGQVEKIVDYVYRKYEEIVAKLSTKSNVLVVSYEDVVSRCIDDVLSKVIERLC